MAADPTPYTRLAVPAASDGKLGISSGTYFRLGSYVEKDEGSLFPPATLVYTTSTVTSTAQTLPDITDAKAAAEAYNTVSTDNPTAISSAGSSSTTPTTADGNIIVNGDGTAATNAAGSRIRNSTRQFELNKIAIAPTNGTLLKKGIFAKTDGDIIATADGGAVIDLEQGFALTSQKGDFTVSLPEGSMRISTTNGIELQAGNSTVASNIALTAFGYIKQAAYGPLDDVRFATSTTKTYGWTKEWFYGEKYSEFHGTSTSIFKGTEYKTVEGTSDSKFNGETISYYKGTRSSYNIAGTTSISFSGDFGVHLGTKLDINVGLYMKILAIGEAKIFGIIDFKFGFLDMKYVFMDSKFYNAEVKGGFFKVKENTMAGTGSGLKWFMDGAHSGIGSIYASIHNRFFV
jgi:hypothetical protein